MKYKIPAYALHKIKSKVARYERKAARLGCEPMGFEASEPYFERDTHGNGGMWVDVTVTGKAPRVAGWAFLARIEHTSEGNILSATEGYTPPPGWRQAAPTCDHCGTRRRRRDTYVLRNGNETKRVGRTCLGDFLRGEDPWAALAVWAICKAMRSLGQYCYDSHRCYEVRQYLTHCAAAVREYGWHSRRSGSSTAEAAYDSLLDNAPVTVDDRRLVDTALDWLDTAGDSDYLHNLRVACSLQIFDTRHMGLLASLFGAHKRATERAKERKQRPVSSHVGVVGARWYTRLSLKSVSTFETDFGECHLHTLEDTAGNVFKWFTSNELDEDFEGDFMFTIKKHDTWRGKAQTVITRARVVAKPPRWLCDSGRVYKTKKEKKEMCA